MQQHIPLGFFKCSVVTAWTDFHVLSVLSRLADAGTPLLEKLPSNKKVERHFSHACCMLDDTTATRVGVKMFKTV